MTPLARRLFVFLLLISNNFPEKGVSPIRNTARDSLEKRRRLENDDDVGPANFVPEVQKMGLDE